MTKKADLRVRLFCIWPYLFDRKGQITFEAGVDEEQIIELALESGADDVVTNDDGSIDVFTDRSDFLAAKAVILFCARYTKTQWL